MLESLVADMKRKRNKLDQAIKLLTELDDVRVGGGVDRQAMSRQRGGMSAQQRAKIKRSMKAWWAEQRKAK